MVCWSGTVTDYDIQYRSDAMGRTNYGNWTDYTHDVPDRMSTVSGLTNGSRYQFRVRGGNSTGGGPWSDAFPSGGVVPQIPVPGKVVSVTAVAGDATITVSWDAPTGIITDYDVQFRFNHLGGMTYVDWTDASHDGTSQSFTTAATNLYRYQFRVRGGNSSGEGEWSEEEPSGGVVPKIPVPGKVPVGTATIVSTTAINVAWSAPSGTVTDYDLNFRSDSTGGTNYGNWRNFNIGNTRSLSLSSLDSGARYQFRVRGGNSSGEGEWSDPFPVDTEEPDPVDPVDPVSPITVPGKVTGGSASAGNRRINVSWDAPTTGSAVTGYDVFYRWDRDGGSGTNYGAWNNFNHVGTTRTAMFSSLVNNIRYQFRVRGGNSSGEGLWSDPFPSRGILPTSVGTVPGKVSGVTVVPDARTAIISWDTPTGTITDYDVNLRSDNTGGTNYGNWLILTHIGTARTYTRRNLVVGRRYQFRVRGGNTSEYGPWSDSSPTSGVVISASRAAPGKVSRGVASAVGPIITLTWSAPSGTVTDYDIQVRYKTTGAYVNWYSFNHTGTSRTATIGTFSTRTYQYRVRGVNVDVEGEYSDPFPTNGIKGQAVPTTVPGKVSGGAAAASSGSISITWNAASGTVSEYDIQYRFDNTGGTSYGGWLDISYSGTLRTTSRAFFNGYRHQFRVRGGNSVGEGAWSDAFPSGGVVPVSEAPTVPTNGSAVAGDGTVSISWTYTAQVDSFNVEWQTVTHGQAGRTSYSIWRSTGITEHVSSRTAVHSSAVNGTRYRYRVRASFERTNGAYTLAFPNGGVVPMASAVVVVPGKPSTPSGVSGNKTLTVSWDAPTTGGDVSSYRLEYLPSIPRPTWSLVSSTIGSGTTTYIHKNLSNGFGYRYRVRGSNDVGNGAWSGTSSVLRPSGPPGKPGDPTLSITTFPTEGSDKCDILLSESRLPNNGGSVITSYRFEMQRRRLDAHPGSTFGSYKTSTDITLGVIRWNTTITTGYTTRVRVRAVNANGSGPWSDWITGSRS